MAYRPVQVFASLATKDREKKARNVDENEENIRRVVRKNEVEVSATGELSLPPDRARVTVIVSSKKEAVLEAKTSVQRRLDYILQVLQTHHVKEGDTQISKVIQRVDGLYHMEGEVRVVFVDFLKCQGVCNFLVEKMDETVVVATPEFFHSPQRLEELRRQACLLAVRNARQKAVEVARLLRSSVGQPISIKEESCREWEGPPAQGQSHDQDKPMTYQERIAMATVTVQAKVFASFELKPKEKGRAPSGGR
ncbi:PREDICTED: interleukin-1 receptor-associated kinase 1-binding protein 1-like [Branchiostoma belcheri]|uniref:Interleukin-1 receptor-associated kinase 1-binding protein 1-like n=1 Tax=Branchiostoma belcheri TaxID=7741 RepID=A0A6P5AXW6_BRABE|nr:PREDICTED: interleukin-1 receptor-associated kinase 1-binding protein 1-like [Branchiostoma belcheri]KAI8498674.1 I-kappaB kinase/NF-kappaB signaling [Branchiostoma belcheri]